MRKILIDTDPGQDIDDLLAIHFALLRPELQVAAITTVTWTADQRARLIKRLLRYMNRTDIPVAPGMAYPLRPMSDDERRQQHDLSRSMNHACFIEPPDDRDAPDAPDAADLIIRIVEQNPGQVMLCCIAPLTNIAVALCRRPDIAPMIQAVALMGGQITHSRAEHNIAFDPVASDIVFSANIPIHMGTWDVTRRFTLPMDIVGRFAALNTPLGLAMAQAITAWHPAQSWKPGPVMYDIFPIIHATGSPCYTLEQKSIRIETHGELTRGHTVLAGRSEHIHVTTDIDVDRVRDLYYQTAFP